MFFCIFGKNIFQTKIMENRIIELLQGIFEKHSAEEQAEIVNQLSQTLPLKTSEIEWKIGAGYDEENNEIGLSFSPISTPAQTQTGLPFAELIRLYLSRSKEVEIAYINYMLLAFLCDARTETVRIFCIPSGFVGERGVADISLIATPSPKAEAERKRYKQEDRELLNKLVYEAR